ncbi:MAG: hypothetical protein U0234_05310 [Sandaracinus sp.]
MSGGFDDFLKSLQPPPDGTYPFEVVACSRSTFEVRFTLEVIDGDYAGKRARVTLNIERDFATIQKVMDVINASDAQSERDLAGRRLYATIRHGDTAGKLFLSKPEPMADEDAPSAP